MTVAFTISTANYLPYAQALAQSFLHHNSGSEFIIVLADDLPQQALYSHQKIITVDRMNIPGFDQMNSSYSIFELSCALKPFAASYILDTIENCNAVFYFDCDILVYAPLDKADILLQSHPVILTPHINFTPDYSVKEEVELMVLKAGIYNAGFFGVNGSAEGKSFLAWWKERMKRYCYIDMPNGLFVDQLWLNLVPAYLPGSFILRDAGYNAAYWNLGERKIESVNGHYVVNGTSPLVFYHFSGHNIHEPGILTRHLAAFNFENRPEMRPLFDEYRNNVLKNNMDDLLSIEPKYGKPQKVSLPPEAPPLPSAKREKFLKRIYKRMFGRN